MMESLYLIAAIGKNGELGKNNQLIWHLKEDLKFFKEKTMGHDIVMGYQTFCSLPKILPGRKHIVLTHREMNLPKEVIICHSLQDLKEYLEMQEKECFVIGGASIYEQMLPECNKLYLTRIEASDPFADAYFPKFDEDDYDIHLLGEHEENKIHYKHLEYVRKKV